LADKPVIANSRATLTFTEAGKVAGNGSCNRFTGSAEINGSAIKFGPLAATRMMCEPDASKQETEYLKLLEGVQRFEMKNGKLYLYCKWDRKATPFPRDSLSSYSPFEARNSRTTAATSRWSASTCLLSRRISSTEIFPARSERASRSGGNFSRAAFRTTGTAS
jgi:hypothetical protein